MTEDAFTQTEASVEQHSLVQSVVLHLLPGVLTLLFYIITAPLAGKLGFPWGEISLARAAARPVFRGSACERSC
jgi:hypothetical protein